MSDTLSRRVLVGLLIVVLHLPLVSFAYLMHGSLAPGQSIADLSALAILTLLIFTALPYAILGWLRIDWNPPHARLGEYEG